MAFTYDISTDLGRLRFELADTREDSHGFTDEELNALLASEANIWAAAVVAIDMLIMDRARFARAFTSADGTQVNETTTLADLRAHREVLAKKAGTDTRKARVHRMREPDNSPIWRT